MSQSCRKRRRKPRAKSSSRRSTSLVFTTLLCVVASGGVYCIDYSSYLATLTANDDIDNKNSNTETAEQEIYGSDAASWPSSATRRSSSIYADDDAIPKVVLRPRTRIKLEAEQRQKQMSSSSRSQHPSITPPTSTSNKNKRPALGAAAPATAQGGASSSRSRTAPVPTPKIGTKQEGINTNREARDIQLEEEIRKEEQEFMEWCTNVLGIYSVLEIQTFEHEYLRPVAPDWEDDMKQIETAATADGEDDSASAPSETTKISIRGLAASRDILEGQSVIRIPVQALYSVATTMEQDPILSQVLPKHAAAWLADDPQFYELPLLAVALLHHRRLGAASPVAPYLRILLRTPVEDMPFLWSAERMQSQSEGVRLVARGIRQEVRSMYDSVVQVLVEENPDLFGQTAAVVDGVWMFSFEMFQWAFAIVNSRHWQLPIADLAPALAPNAREPATSSTTSSSSSVEDQVPPASMPTDSWVQERGDVDDDVTAANETPPDTESAKGTATLSVAHSFLAPVADLLNFGYPCTRVQFDDEQRVFEVIATCSFHKGEEVTFWYSNECDEVMFGVYGFRHALIQPCKTSEEWRLYAAELEEQLEEAYEDLEMLEDQFEMVEAILGDCDCCDEEEPRLRHEQQQQERRSTGGRSSRRSSKGSSDRRQQGIRHTWSRKSEF